MLTRRRALFYLIATAPIWIVETAQPQGYPLRPVRMIVPFPSGAGVDVVARLLAPSLAERLHQNIVIDNRAGAGGTIGAVLAASSAADGYTFFMATPGQVFGQNLYRKPPYDLLRDFAPITLVAATPNLLVVNASVPAASVKEFIEPAKAKQRQLNFACAGSGAARPPARDRF